MRTALDDSKSFCISFVSYVFTADKGLRWGEEDAITKMVIKLLPVWMFLLFQKPHDCFRCLAKDPSRNYSQFQLTKEEVLKKKMRAKFGKQVSGELSLYHSSRLDRDSDASTVFQQVLLNPSNPGIGTLQSTDCLDGTDDSLLGASRLTNELIDELGGTFTPSENNYLGKHESIDYDLIDN